MGQLVRVSDLKREFSKSELKVKQAALKTKAQKLIKRLHLVNLFLNRQGLPSIGDLEDRSDPSNHFVVKDLISVIEQLGDIDMALASTQNEQAKKLIKAALKVIAGPGLNDAKQLMKQLKPLCKLTRVAQYGGTDEFNVEPKGFKDLEDGIVGLHYDERFGFEIEDEGRGSSFRLPKLKEAEKKLQTLIRKDPLKQWAKVEEAIIECNKVVRDLNK
jgi:hypothetical protein